MYLSFPVYEGEPSRLQNSCDVWIALGQEHVDSLEPTDFKTQGAHYR